MEKVALIISIWLFDLDLSFSVFFSCTDDAPRQTTTATATADDAMAFFAGLTRLYQNNATRSHPTNHPLPLQYVSGVVRWMKEKKKKKLKMIMMSQTTIYNYTVRIGNGLDALSITGAEQCCSQLISGAEE